jgi:anti-sigma regulatory factor (Ser/Thr protein kinase)
MNSQSLAAEIFFKEIAINTLADTTVAKRIAGNYAAKLKFPPNRKDEAVLVASELAHNHLQHRTKEGKIRLLGLNMSSRRSLTVASLDKGPGIDDLSDIHHKATFSGLGAGLNSVARLADQFDICSGETGPAACLKGVCDYQTLVTAVLWADKNRPGNFLKLGLDSAVIASPLRDNISGDGLFVQYDGRYVRFTVVDSAGHGHEAAWITEKAGEELQRLGLFWPVEHIISSLEQSLAATRGLAIQVCQLDRRQHILQSAGMGNICSRFYIDDKCVSPLGNSGVVGHLRGQEVVTQRFGPFSRLLVITHTDGQQSLPEFKLPTNRFYSSSLWGNILFAPGRIQPDDTTLVVWQWPGKLKNQVIS